MYIRVRVCVHSLLPISMFYVHSTLLLLFLSSATLYWNYIHMYTCSKVAVCACVSECSVFAVWIHFIGACVSYDYPLVLLLLLLLLLSFSRAHYTHMQTRKHGYAHMYLFSWCVANYPKICGTPDITSSITEATLSYLRRIKYPKCLFRLNYRDKFLSKLWKHTIRASHVHMYEHR